MKLTKNYYIKKSTNPAPKETRKVKSVYLRINADNNYIDIQYAPLKFSYFQYRPHNGQAASGTHQQPNTQRCSAQHNPHPHNTDKNINLVHWHTIEFSNNNHTTIRSPHPRCVTKSVNGKSKNNFDSRQRLFSYRQTHQNLMFCAGRCRSR